MCGIVMGGSGDWRGMVSSCMWMIYWGDLDEAIMLGAPKGGIPCDANMRSFPLF